MSEKKSFLMTLLCVRGPTGQEANHIRNWTMGKWAEESLETHQEACFPCEDATSRSLPARGGGVTICHATASGSARTGTIAACRAR